MTAATAYSPKTGSYYLTKSLVWALCLMGTFFALRSVFLAIELERSLPFADQWVFVVNDYFRYLDGECRWTDMFAHHNEHRIGTTRVVLWVDALLFNMQGWVPLLVQYLNLAGIAALIAGLTKPRGDNFFAIFIPALALTWSISQFENFAWAFQPSFSFVHLFAIATLIALTRALDTERWGSWLILACGFDLLAANSLASGLLIVAPAICSAIWMRQIDRRILIFCAAHLIISAWYFVGYVPHAYNGYGVPTLWRGLDLIAQFIGMDIGGLYYLQIPAGQLSIVAFLLTAIAVTWAVVVKRIALDQNSAVLLATATFVVAEAVTVAFARADFDLGPRYATMSTVFQCGLLGFCWRQSALFLTAKPLRLALIAVSATIIVNANAPRWEDAWRMHAALIDQAVDHFSKGEYKESTADSLMPNPPETWVRRYQSLHLAPFSSSGLTSGH